MKVGIMGGTFDPIHVAHLMAAEQARSELDIERVLFLPAGKPWMKESHVVATAEDRLTMVRLAIASNPAFEVSTVELDRSGSTYTVDTLEQLWQQFGADCKLFLLLGWDSLADFPKWKAPTRISRLATLVAFPRPGYARPNIDMFETSVPGLKERIVLLNGPSIDISSTVIRQKVAAGRSIRYLVPDNVAAYIVSHNLYRAKPD
jgi:nicotinate-nucleotide adenylyltransferase